MRHVSLIGFRQTVASNGRPIVVVRLSRILLGIVYLGSNPFLAASSHASAQCCLQLNLSGDRTRPFRTKLPVNQPYLDKIAAPPDAAVLTPAFEQLAQLQREGKLPALRVGDRHPHAQWRCLLQDGNVRDVRTCGERMLEASSPRRHNGVLPPAPSLCGRERPPGGGKATAPTRTEDLVARWRRAEEDAIYADDHRSARYFLSIFRPSTALRASGDYPDFFRQLALLAAAHWQHRVGLDDGPDGAEALFTMLAERSEWLRHPAQLGLADLAFSRGQYADARQRYAALTQDCQDKSVTDWSHFRIAECDEFEGRLAEATVGYEASAKSEDRELAAEADYEPGRVYTISVFDEQGHYLTGAEARYFVRGVYYRLAASGPQHLKFRLWRNLAYNLIFAGIFLDRPGKPGAWPEKVTLWAPHKTSVALP